MKFLLLLLLLSFFITSCTSLNDKLHREPATDRENCADSFLKLRDNLLSHFDQNIKPWSFLDAEQPYVYIGASPREMALFGHAAENPVIPRNLKTLGEAELKRLRRRLNLSSAEFEIYPNYDSWGVLTWVFARYRESPRHVWKWLNESHQKRGFQDLAAGPSGIVLPEILDPKNPEDRDRLFNDIPEDLYQRPEFGSSLWLAKDGKTVTHAWASRNEKEAIEKEAIENGYKAVSLPPPARFNDEAKTFVVRTDSKGIHWPEEIQWQNERKSPPKKLELQPLIENWPSDFKEKYLADLKYFDGEIPIHSPDTGKIIDFGKQSSGQKDNQLLDTLAYMRKRHEDLGYGKIPGFEIEEQHFNWLGIAQANLIIKIKGKNKGADNKPVIMSGHYDKAVAEDTYDNSGNKLKVTTPGADDNGTAIAALFRAAEIFKDRYENNPPENDIWLVHFTGEEFPAGTLGARHFVSQLLKDKIDVTANINLDMLGHRTKGDKIFQINPGSTEASMNLAEIAKATAEAIGGNWQPVIRHNWGRRSYLAQTDGEIFNWAGYPTILINEHINLSRRLNPTYHQSDDFAKYVDLNYAVAQSKTAIETAIRMAGQ